LLQRWCRCCLTPPATASASALSFHSFLLARSLASFFSSSSSSSSSSRPSASLTGSFYEFVVWGIFTLLLIFSPLLRSCCWFVVVVEVLIIVTSLALPFFLYWFVVFF
jgi:hypothetical protein